MPLCKVLVDYKPQEGWKPGDIVDITDPTRLLIEGKVVLVDEQGHEIERPNIITCPICPPSIYSAPSATALAVHILDTHSRTGAVPPTRRERLIKEKDKGKGMVTEEAVKESVMAKEEMDAIEDVKAKQEEARRQRVLDLAQDRAADYIDRMERKAKKVSKEKEKKPKKKKIEGLDKMSWVELQKVGAKLGVYKVGMNKAETIEALQKQEGK